MAIVNYPESFPVESIAYVVSVLRKQETADKAKLGHGLWVTQGYVQKIVLGEPDTQAILGPMSINAETLALALETLNPERPQAILGGNLTKKLLFMAIARLVEKLIGGSGLPATIDELLNEILGGLLSS